MGFLDAIFNPTKNTNAGYSKAIRGIRNVQETTNPYYESLLSGGTQANSLLMDLLGLNGVGAQSTAIGNYQTSPAFDAQLAAGTQGITQNAAARGLLNSGATAKGLQSYGQDLYNQDYGNYLSRLAGLSSGGLAGASGLNSGASQLAQLRIGRGQAQDAGNQSAFGNILGIAGTAIGAATGMPMGFGGGGSPTQLGNSGGRLFGGSSQYYPGSGSQMPYYAFGSGAIF
jgi:hypothetical protein